MSYRFKRAAFQIAVMASIIGALRFSFDGMITSNWLAGLSIFIATLFNAFVVRAFSHRHWPEPKKGWVE